MPSRRSILRGAAAAAALSCSVGSATAAVDARDEHQPDHVTLEYDREALERYRPLLDVSTLEIRPTALYGWVASSPEHETNVAVYWARYRAQRGRTPVAWAPLSDSHRGDHEPVYVEYDPSTDDVVGVAFDGYHWLRAWHPASAVDIHEETHVKLEVVPPWHFYRTTSRTLAGFVELADLTGAFDDWLANDLDEALEPGTAVNPWRMVGAGGRSHWWADGGDGVSLRAQLSRIDLMLGAFSIGGARQSELG